MTTAAALLLLAALAGIWWFQKGDLGEYRRFSALNDSHSRRMRFRLWLARSALAFLCRFSSGWRCSAGAMHWS
ncbi:hypothetical protein GCM10020258_24380 [Sphingomonas yabuuchiae]